MSNIQWWRSWHGAPTDHKWAVIAARSGVKTGIVSAIGWALLDYASQQKERGSVKGFDPEEYAVYSGFSQDEITAVMRAMEDKGILKDGAFVNWEKRQPKREDDNSTERVREWREKKRNETQCNAENAEVTISSLSVSLSDSLSVSDKGIEEEENDDFQKIRRCIERETGLLGDGANAVQAIDEMLKNGCIEEDIVNGIKWRVGEGKRITSYSQLVGPANTARLKRIQGGNGHSTKTRILQDAKGNLLEVPA